MLAIRMVFAGFVAAIALAVALHGAQAQTQSEPLGKPTALLAGLRPPPELKHKATKHALHAKTEHGVIKKTAAGTRHGRVAAAHMRHASTKKLARRKYEHHERTMTASAFAEESPPESAAASPAVFDLPTASPSSSAADDAAASNPAAAPSAGNSTPPTDLAAYPDPPAAKVQTVRIIPANQSTVSDPSADVASAAVAPSDNAAAAAPLPTVGAAQAQEQKTEDADPVGSASWIAQVLAALGGAVAAGAVAWFLIGGGPVRTYS